MSGRFGRLNADNAVVPFLASGRRVEEQVSLTGCYGGKNDKDEKAAHELTHVSLNHRRLGVTNG